MSAKQEITRFNLRVYGICIQDASLLITDEIRHGVQMCKLPGGGLEYGEGIENCLKREWLEELEVEIEVGDVFFVTPFFLQSAFRKTDQVICLYYEMKMLGEPKGIFSNKPMDFAENDSGDQQVFRWVDLDDLDESVFTFASDKALVGEFKRRTNTDIRRLKR